MDHKTGNCGQLMEIVCSFLRLRMRNQYTKFQPDTLTLDEEIKYANFQGWGDMLASR